MDRAPVIDGSALLACALMVSLVGAPRASALEEGAPVAAAPDTVEVAATAFAPAPAALQAGWRTASPPADVEPSAQSNAPCFGWIKDGLTGLVKVIAVVLGTYFVCGLCKVTHDAVCALPAEQAGIDADQVTEMTCVGVGAPLLAGGAGYLVGAGIPVLAPPGVPEAQRDEASGLVAAGACAGCALVCAGGYCVNRLQQGAPEKRRESPPKERRQRPRRRRPSSTPPPTPAEAPLQVERDAGSALSPAARAFAY